VKIRIINYPTLVTKNKNTPQEIDTEIKKPLMSHWFPHNYGASFQQALAFSQPSELMSHWFSKTAYRKI